MRGKQDKFVGGAEWTQVISRSGGLGKFVPVNQKQCQISTRALLKKELHVQTKKDLFKTIGLVNREKETMFSHDVSSKTTSPKVP